MEATAVDTQPDINAVASVSPLGGVVVIVAKNCARQNVMRSEI